MGLCPKQVTWRNSGDPQDSLLEGGQPSCYQPYLADDQREELR